MVKLTDEMQEVFEKKLCFIATASSDGTPNVVPKGSTHVADDETLVFCENREEKTFRNLQENPKVAVIAIDRDKGGGYQAKGTAELLTAGDFFEKVAKKRAEGGRPKTKNVVRIKIEEIYPVMSSLYHSHRSPND